MDSKHRHELAENDLQAFLTHFGAWWGKHGNKVLTGVLLVLLVILGTRFWSYQKTTALENAWSDLEQTQTPEGFMDVAERHDVLAVQAIARTSAADLLLREVAIPRRNLPGVEAGEPVKPVEADPDRKLDAAASQYRLVADGTRYPMVFRLNARLGLATVAEQRGDWAEARKQFQRVIDESDGYEPIAAQAKGRLAKLDVLPNAPTFAPEPPPVAPSSDAGFAPVPPLEVPNDASPGFLDTAAEQPATEIPTPAPTNPIDPATTAPADEPVAP